MTSLVRDSCTSLTESATQFSLEDRDFQSATTINGFMEKLTDYTQNPPNLKQNVKAFAEAAYSEEDITVKHLKPGGAKGVSGAHIFFVMNDQNVRVAVAKVFANKREELMQELRAIHTLNQLNLRHVHCVTVLNVGKCSIREGAYPMILETIAKGKGIDDHYEEFGKNSAYKETLKKIIYCAGRAFRELHESTCSRENADITEYIKAIREMVGKVQALEQGLKIEFSQCIDIIHSIIGANERAPGHGVIIHGDSHPGNLFALTRGDECTITFIDLPSLALSTNPGFRTGKHPPARDFSNFKVRSIDACVKSKINVTVYGELMSEFDRGYNAANPEIP